MTALRDFLWHGVYFLLGWSWIPRTLQKQIDFVLDHLPESFDDGVLIIHRIAPWRLILFHATLGSVAGWFIARREGSDAWIIGAAAVGIAFALAMLRCYPLMLVLDAHGVRFIYRDCVIDCPWLLFAAHGEPVDEGVILHQPVNAEAIDDVEMRRNGRLMQAGAGVQMDAFTFLDDTQLKLRNTLQIATPTLGMLLQEVGFAMTQERNPVTDTPAGTPKTAKRLDSIATAPQHWTRNLNIGVVEGGRHITLPVTRLLFPLECCICGLPTSETSRIGVRGMYFIIRTSWFLHFNIPCCRRCHRHESLRAWTGGIVGASVALAGASAITVAILGPPAGDWSLYLLLTGMLALLPTLWALDFGGRCLLRMQATYQRLSECVRLSFRQSGYADRVSEFHRQLAGKADESQPGEPGAHAQNMQMTEPVVYDKAKYHHETVVDAGLDDVQAEVHTAFFLGWLIDNDLMSDEFNQECPELIDRYRSREINALEVYECWDCCLVDDMLSDAGNAFAQHYFAFDRGQYLPDYWELLVRDLPSEFHVPYTWDNYEIIQRRIDERYDEWRST